MTKIAYKYAKIFLGDDSFVEGNVLYQTPFMLAVESVTDGKRYFVKMEDIVRVYGY